MKKLRFALLAIAVLALTFAFTTAPEKTGPTATVYAFNTAGVYLGSANSLAALKASHCPGRDEVLCCRVYADKDAQDQPVGPLIAIIYKPAGK